MTSHRLLFLAPVLALTLIGCSKNPAENVPAAEVRPAQETAPAAQPAPQESAAAPAPTPDATESGTYVFGPEGSTIDFVGSKVTGSHDGGFKKFAGELKVANGQLVGSGNKIVIDTTSLWSDNEKLTEHLKSADFFDVAKYPTAEFVTTSVTPTGTNTMITGNLTLHGVTKQISFPASVGVSADWVKASAEFFLKRDDFGIAYAGKADDLIRQEVVIKLKVNAKPGQAADFQSAQGPAQTNNVSQTP